MDKNAAIQSAQFSQLISLSKVSLVANVLLALLLAYMEREVVAPAVLASWLALVLLTALLRGMLVFAQRRPARQEAEAAGAALTRFRLCVLLGGAAWGSAGVLLFAADHAPHQIFLIFALGGMTAGGVVSFSADLFSAIAFSVLVIVPLVIRLFAAGDGLSAAMAVATTVYLAFMILSLWRIHRQVRENISLHIEAAEREEQMRVSEERHRLLLSHLPVGVFHYDSNLVVTYCNPLFADMLNTTSERLVGLDLRRIKEVAILPALEKALTGELGHYEGIYRATFSESEKWLSMSCAPFRDEHGRIAGGIAIVQDISERKAAEETIRNFAFYDHLTNLPNRRLFMDRLQQAMAASARSGRHGALLFIDLDNFKTLNDTLGHDMGDLLLQQVAQRLASCVRESDSVARLGGDEFVVLLEDLSGEQAAAARFAEEVGGKLIASLGQAYHLGRHEYCSTPSIGAALFSGHLLGKEELLKRADLAMYQAKKDGRNLLRFFEGEASAPGQRAVADA